MTWTLKYQKKENDIQINDDEFNVQMHGDENNDFNQDDDIDETSPGSDASQSLNYFLMTKNFTSSI